MKLGEIVRLKYPFKPASGVSQEYSFGVVVGLVLDDSPEKKQPELTEIVLHLYDPDTSSIYVDEAGTPAIYSFYPNEISRSLQTG